MCILPMVEHFFWGGGQDCGDQFVLFFSLSFRRYWGLSKTFNPTKFNPNVWADAADKAGMRYFVMTTKHHDGFAMYVHGDHTRFFF
jgi:hypothetical protein